MNIPSGIKDEKRIVEDFLLEDFEIVRRENIDLKTKRTLFNNHRININQIAEKTESYNSTDFGNYFTKRLILLGKSKELYFAIYDKGGRVPTRILSIGYFNSKIGTFVDLILHDQTVSKVTVAKQNIKEKKYTNNFQ